jgi:hypothetical protein
MTIDGVTKYNLGCGIKIKPGYARIFRKDST